MERKLEFNKLVIPQILQTLGFYIVAVVLAWRGFGIVSFTWAVMLRAVIGLVVTYIICPWKPVIYFSRDVAKKLMRFGVPFQLNSFIALLKDDLLTVFLGKVLPFAAIGYIGWAKKWAEVPLRLIMDSVIQVTFPAFSRLQEAKQHLAAAIEKTLFGLSLTMFPIYAGLLFFVQPLMIIIPKYAKWEPALLAFYLFTFSSILAGLSTPLTNALNAIGKIKITLILMVMWTVLTWILVLTLIHFFGFNGVPIALFSVSATIIVVVLLVKHQVQFSFFPSIITPLIASVIQGAWYAIFLHFIPDKLLWLIPVAGSGVILYAGIVWIIEKRRIMDTLRAFNA
jgi:O-antigen/teichoic acid export membrane protein